MKCINELFFELIRVSIGTQDNLSRLPEASKWGKLYKMAQKQSLVGVCFVGLQRLGADADEGFARIGMSEELYFDWMGNTFMIQQKNSIVNQQCAELQAKLSADGFRSYIMKGQTNAALYGDLSPLRQSGDIDVYLEGGLDKVLTYAKTFGSTKKVNELEMHVKVFDYTEVEFHYRPFIMRNPFRNAKLQRFFKECEEANFSNSIILNKEQGLAICAPTTEFNLVHQMVHVYHHLFTEGIGMRQLMDYYFVLQSACEVTKAQGMIHSLGLDRFASALMWIMGDVFGLPKEKMPWAPDENDGRFLLKEIMQSGNFGHMDETKADLSNKWKSFWYVNSKTIRFWRFDHWAWFWSPIWRLYHFGWRKVEGFE